MGRVVAGGFYNGKLEEPVVASRCLTALERAALCNRPRQRSWTTPLSDLGFQSRHSNHACGGYLATRPARHHRQSPDPAMKGHAWDGSEYNWVHNLLITVPSIFTMTTSTTAAGRAISPSPCQRICRAACCAHLTQDGHEDYVPFVVRPPRGTARAPLALCCLRRAYWAYANRHVEIE